ncbi:MULTISPECIES: ketosynthase chain-length factor [Streptomyces violaceusniger group]|uniref:Ketosynthase chain-length factor n=2 Tax=Streptomyces javensis TaxID=114698 RepID=A0ABP4HV21_9ACTN|nr:ketosynthase chain-length factor [Streptomyces javensis]MBI0313402.1 ketosynthase chain-length factor [Streptomyces javensis]
MNATVLVTGLGIVAPTGLGIEDYWSATLAGRSAVGRVTHFDPTPYPSRLAGEISGFAAEEYLPGRLLPQTDRMTRLALVGADWAFTDAGVVPSELPAYDVGVITASHSGGFEFGQNELRALWSKGGRHVSAYQSFAWFYAVNSGQISIRNGLRGPSSVVVSDQAGGLDALAQARRQLRKGVSVVIAGAVDASICPWGWVAQMTSGRLSTSDDPARAYLPFDDRAAGHVPGEGGALLVLEAAEHARRRGAPRVYGEIAGHAATIDPRPGSDRAPTLQRAIELALADAGTAPEDIGVVFADAAAVPDLDRAEAEAITKVFGPRGVPVTAPKTTTGRLYSGAAALDLAAAFLSIRDQVIPPTVGSTLSPSYEIDLVSGAPRPAEPRSALVIARGQGGFNSAMVVRAAEPAHL